MNKGQLVEVVAKALGSKSAAEKAINSTLKAITDALKKGDKVTLVGFGTFKVDKRKARKGRSDMAVPGIIHPRRRRGSSSR